MGKITTLTLSLLVLLTATSAHALVTDAPHNDTYDVTCNKCHSYSLWWKYSPTSMDQQLGSTAIYDAICDTCHDGVQETTMGKHSDVIGTGTHGSWGTACVDCHDPHFQAQLDWVDAAGQTYPNGLYLAEGSIDTVAPGTIANTTDITYSGATPDNGSGDWTDRNRWAGLILTVDKINTENTYQIISANDTIITVQGDVEAIAPGTSLGVLYGQMIKQVMSTPNSGEKAVHFFNPETVYDLGGYVNVEGDPADTSSSVTTGMCQVCHTDTTYWTHDGIGNDTISDVAHNQNSACTECHNPLEAFKPVAAHDFLTVESPCTNCHQHQTTPIDILAIHNNNCQTCHTTVPALRSDSANWTLVTQIGTVNNNKSATACTFCHTAYYEGHTHSHTTSVTANSVTTPATADCVGCHTGNVITAVHDLAAAGGDAPCAKCHDLSTDGALRTTAIADATANGAAGGECVTCHTAYFDAHTRTEHNAAYDPATDKSQNPAQGCQNCHGKPLSGDPAILSLATWPDILFEHNSCSTCHDSERAVNVDAAYGSIANVIASAAITSTNKAECLTCHADKATPNTHGYVAHNAAGSNGYAPITADADCILCHTVTGDSVVSGIHKNKCSSCHTSVPTLKGASPDLNANQGTASSSCTTCHNSSNNNGFTKNFHGVTAATAGAVHNLSSNGTGDQDCAVCHDTLTSGSAQLLRHMGTDAVANCNNCHTAADAAGASATGIINTATTPVTNLAVNCEECHAGPGDYKAHGMSAATAGTVHDNLAVSANAGAGDETDCAACHTITSVQNRIDLHANCSTCHSATGTAVTVIAAGYGATPVTANCESCHAVKGDYKRHGLTDDNGVDGVVDVHNNLDNESQTAGSSCSASACHNTTTDIARLQTHTGATPSVTCLDCHQAATPVATVIAASKGVSTDLAQCDECHADNWETLHAAVDHTIRVQADTTCTACHDGNPGTNLTAPNTVTSPYISAAANEVHSVSGCATCHTSAGILQAKNGTYTTQMAQGTCTACHGVNYFDSHVHGTGTNHDVNYVALTDISQGANADPCASCHTPTGALTTWTGIVNEHLGSCATCHSYVDGGEGTPLEIEVTNAMTATGVTCTTCHVKKLSPAATSTHGGHPSDAFGFDSNCADCHGDGTGTDPVVSAIHGGSCTICHSSAAANRDNEKVGDAANGEDGDARLANGTALAADSNIAAWNTPTCTTCHPTTTYDVSTVHHASKTSYAADGNCVQCHNTGTNNASHAGVHTASVADTANCNSCHTATKGSADNVPVATGDGKVHDACITCHNTDANGTLKAAYGLASAMPVGGGDCNACHGAYFISHTNADHTARVAVGTTGCDSCHTATKGTATSVPVTAGDDKVHDTCTTCHNATTGDLNGGVTTYGAQALASGDCGTCHTATYFDSHTHATNHAVSFNATLDRSQNSNTAANQCDVCHLPAGTAWTGIFDEHSNSCATCHSYAANQTGDPNTPDITLVGTIITNNTTSTCITCHTVKDQATGAGSVHGGHDATIFTWSTSCGASSCHDSGTNTNIADIHNACTTCHTTAAGGSGTAIVGSSANGTDGDAQLGAALADYKTATCETCHPSSTYDWASIHTVTATAVDHSAVVTAADLGVCTSCHDAGANSSQAKDAITVPYVVAGQVHQAGCTSCHTATGGINGTSTLAPSLSATGGNCTSCHGIAWQTLHAAATMSHNSLVSGDVSCTNCHDGNPGSNTTAPNTVTSPYVGATEVHNANGCTTCHNAAGTLTALTGNYTSAMAAGDCTTCHGAYFSNHTHSGHTASVALLPSCGTTGCHDATSSGVARGTSAAKAYTGANDVHGPNCATCHTLSATSTNGNRINGGPGQGNATGAGGNCAACHTTSWDAIHTGVTLVNHSMKVASLGTCATCHTGTGGNAQIAVNSATNRTGDMLHDGCIDCHNTDGSTKTAYGYASAITAGNCGTCHGSTYFDNHEHGTTAGYISHVVSYTAADVAQAGSQGCGECHDDAALGKGVFGAANALTTWDAVKTEHFGACATCHSYSAGTTPPAATNNAAIGSRTAATCVTCHTQKEAPATHGGHDAIQFGGDAACTSCHTIPATGVVEGIHGNTCTLCHDNASGGAGTTIVGANGDGNAQLGNSAAPHSGVTCLTCHPSATYPADGVHHDTAHPQAGDCAYCHDDPRGAPGVDWGTQYGVSGTIANQLACQSCHVESVGNDLVVNRLSYTPVALSSSPGVNFNVDSRGVATVQNLGAVHSITATGSKINVYNYGTCLGCHDGNHGTAPAVSIFHAKPVKLAHNSNSWTTSPFDTLRYAPGRDKFYLFRSDLRDPEDFMKNGSAEGRGKEVFKQYRSNGWPTPNPSIEDQMTTIPCFSLMNSKGKCSNGSNVQVPTFNDISAPTFPDDVQVQSAVWDGASLTVTATNDDGCSELSVITQPGGTNRGSMSGTTTCSLTVAIGTLPTSVDVTTTNGLGTDVLGYSVADTSAPTPAAATVDNMGAAASGVTNLDVMANDIGTGITITNVTQPALGSVAIVGSGVNTTINYTAAGVGSTSFTYTIQAEDFSTSIGIVNLTVTANQPPAFGQASYTMANGSEGALYSETINGFATDPEADTINYSKDGGTCSWATVAANGAIGGTPPSATTCTVIARASAIGGFDTATLNITVNAAPTEVISLDSWTSANTPASNTISYTVPSGTNRMLVVSIGVENSSGAVGSISATYGGAALTSAAQIGDGASSYNNYSYIGICNEACIAAGGGGTQNIVFTVSGGSYNAGVIGAGTYGGVNQSAPLFDTNAVNAGNIGTNAQNFSINVADGGQAIVGANFNSQSNSLNAVSGWTEMFDIGTGSAGGGNSHTYATITRNVTTAASPATVSLKPASSSSRTNFVGISLQP